MGIVGAFGAAGTVAVGAFTLAGSGSGPPGSALGGGGRNTKYSTRAIASTSTTLSEMIKPSGTDRFVGAAGFTGVAAGPGAGGAGVADCLISIV